MCRNVGEESSKTYKQKVENGFFDTYMKGVGLDIGYKGYINAEPILPSALGLDLDYPGYNGSEIPLLDNTVDYVYSSHCLEHVADYATFIREAIRVLKPGGYMITVVPHRDLYERRLVPPSRWNGDHKRFYTAASLLLEFESSLPINSYRVRHLRENDEGHDYNQSEHIHANWLYEIELVIEKL